MAEVVLSTTIGFVVAYSANLFILLLFGFRPSHVENFIITCLFTVVSLVRGYAVRRLFNWLHATGRL